MGKIEKALQNMIEMANNNAFGYDQLDRWGVSRDCSSMIIDCCERAGISLKTKGATYTGNMLNVMLNCGFKIVNGSVNFESADGMLPGDVLLNVVHHTVMYCGNGKVVGARINEKGTVTGGQIGDQTGSEISVHAYYNYPWNYCLRYFESSTTSAPKYFDRTVILKAQEFYGCSIKDGVVSYQPVSNKKYLCNCPEPDWQFTNSYSQGSNLVRAMQKDFGCTIDGWCGRETVGAVQTKLRKLGLYTGEIDHSFGPDTVKAFWKYIN